MVSLVPSSLAVKTDQLNNINQPYIENIKLLCSLLVTQFRKLNHLR